MFANGLLARVVYSSSFYWHPHKVVVSPLSLLPCALLSWPCLVCHLSLWAMAADLLLAGPHACLCHSRTTVLWRVPSDLQCLFIIQLTWFKECWLLMFYVLLLLLSEDTGYCEDRTVLQKASRIQCFPQDPLSLESFCLAKLQVFLFTTARPQFFVWDHRLCTIDPWDSARSLNWVQLWALLLQRWYVDSKWYHFTHPSFS